MQPLEVLPNDFPLALFFPANTREVWAIQYSHLIFRRSRVLVSDSSVCPCRVQGKAWEQHLRAVQGNTQVWTGLGSPQPCRGANTKSCSQFPTESPNHQQECSQDAELQDLSHSRPSLCDLSTLPALPQPFPPVSLGFCPLHTLAPVLFPLCHCFLLHPGRFSASFPPRVPSQV